MPLYLPELGADGVVVNNKKSVLPLVLPPQSFFQTNSDVAAGLYSQARAWARDYAGGQAGALAGAEVGRDGAGGAAGTLVSLELAGRTLTQPKTASRFGTCTAAWAALP